MSQGVLYVALYLLGVVFQLAYGPRARPGLCCALGFVTGLAIWGFGALAIVVSPLRYDAWTATAAYGVPLAICAVATFRRWRPSRRDVAIVAAWSVAFAAVVAYLCSFDASRFSPDSRNLVVAGLRLADAGAADTGILATRGVFLILAHSLAAFTHDDYAWALSSVLGLSIAPLFAALAWRAAPRGLVVVVAAVLVTTYNVAFHLFYIHTNLGAAVYLLGALGLLWRAESEQDTSYLPGAMICLGAFALHRVEGPAFAAIVILVALYPSRLPRRPLAIGLALYAIPCALWYARLSSAAPDVHLTTTITLLFAAGTLALLAGFLALPATLCARAPIATLLAMVVALGAGALLHPGFAETSARAMYTNLLDTPLAMWGHTWWVILALALLSLFVPAPPHGRALAYAALCTALLILLLGFRHPYRVGVTDSANRMILQVLPLAVLYFTVQFAPAGRRATR